ncbi:MAG: hypothetical protein C5B44_04330 [Acidobacteria bacterium]|nr:MAG: hypothetical protein C5B44_04330 [Acidobacteriota bacterium]
MTLSICHLIGVDSCDFVDRFLDRQKRIHEITRNDTKKRHANKNQIAMTNAKCQIVVVPREHHTIPSVPTVAGCRNNRTYAKIRRDDFR